MVETTFDVTFQYPLSGTASAQRDKAIADSICGAAFPTKAVRIRVRCRFRNGVECQLVKRLHCSIFHRWYAKRPFLTIGFGNVYPSQRRCLVAMLSKIVYSSYFLHRFRPGFPIYPRCPFTLVFRHSFYSQGFAAKLAGQQSLQDFHFAPSAFLSCLHNACLQPFHIPVYLLPVYGMPPFSRMRGRTSHEFR